MAILLGSAVLSEATTSDSPLWMMPTFSKTCLLPLQHTHFWSTILSTDFIVSVPKAVPIAYAPRHINSVV